ncbi:MAG: triple tyrosine motif-containing protein [Salibacteraceae bacterium]
MKFRMSEGLQGNNYLYQLTRDSKGFIWVSAQSGLSYYDGNEFHRYEARHGLPDHNVLRTFEDPHHTIWLQTYSGDLLRVANDTLLPYRYNETIRHLLNTDRVWHFGFDSVGNLYLGHNMRGLWQVDTSGQLSNLIAFEDGVARVSIWRSARCPPIGFRTRKDLGTAVPETLTIYNENLEIETEIPLEHDPVNPNRRVFYNTCQDGALAVVYGGDLFKISPDGNYQHNRQPLLYNGVMEDRAGNLWTASFGYGLMGFPNGYLGPASPETDTTFFISILPRNFFHSIIEDHEGGFWMGSFTNGLFYISDPQLEKIILSKTEPDRNYLYSLTQSKDRLFAIATSKTLLEVNAQGTQRHEFWEALFDQPGGTFSSLYWHAPQKRLYLGHKKQLLYLEASEHFKQLHELKLPNQRPIRIIQSGIDSGYFWVSDRLSIFRISPLGVETAPVTLGHYTTAFQEMPDGSLWSGSEKGLFYQSGDTMKHFEHASPLVNSRINTLYQHEGKLWMTNVNKGCAILSKDSLILFDDKEFGLIIPYGYWPEQDTMWAASGKDLVKFVCYPNDSITVEKFPVLKDENTRVMDLRFFQGHFYIATTSGLLKLKRSFTQKLIPPPPVYLTGLQINDRDTSLQAHYDLPYHQNRLRLNFTGLSFRSPPTHYRYRLTGLDSAWHMIRQPSTQFTELSPGRYVFEVHALTKDGKWSEVPASLSFIIHPPYWATGWII